jgi:hypothetical protein
MHLFFAVEVEAVLCIIPYNNDEEPYSAKHNTVCIIV